MASKYRVPGQELDDKVTVARSVHGVESNSAKAKLRGYCVSIDAKHVASQCATTKWAKVDSFKDLAQSLEILLERSSM